MRKLLIATKNEGKFREFLGILKDLPFIFLTINDLKKEVVENFEVKESGKTFEENAIIKAQAYGRLTGFLTLAEDSGLCVNYLKGGPGVATHRYAPGSDKDRYEKLLRVMKDVPLDKRGAKFVAVIALFFWRRKLRLSMGGDEAATEDTGPACGNPAFPQAGRMSFSPPDECRGKKRRATPLRRGRTSFDPKTGRVKTTYGKCKGSIAFEPRGTHGFGYDPVFIAEGLNKHFAELTLEEKNQVSHRAKALKKMRKILVRQK